MGICNPLSPDATKYIVRSPLASPGAFRWILPNQPRSANPIGGVDYVASSMPTRRANGAIIHDGSQGVAQNGLYGKWHHVSIEVDGELMIDAALPPPDPPAVQDAKGNQSSLLKARIRLGMGNSRVREFDFDIGAGVEFDVACYSVLSIEVLIPDPEEGGSFDPPFTDESGVPITAPALQLATVLSPTVYYTTYSGRQHNPLTYTTPTLLDATNPVWLIPRVSESVAITGGINAIAAAGSTVLVDFVYVPSLLSEVLPGSTGFPPFFILDTVAVPTGSSRIPQSLIPGNANAFLVRRTIETTSTLVNVVQVLNT